MERDEEVEEEREDRRSTVIRIIMDLASRVDTPEGDSKTMAPRTIMVEVEDEEVDNREAMAEADRKNTEYGSQGSLNPVILLHFTPKTYADSPYYLGRRAPPRRSPST
jgi:hypothetical protein